MLYTFPKILFADATEVSTLESWFLNCWVGPTFQIVRSRVVKFLELAQENAGRSLVEIVVMLPSLKKPVIQLVE